MVHNNERYSFVQPAAHVQFKTDKQYDSKRELSSHNSINVTHTLFYNLNTVLGVERRLPTYTTFISKRILIIKCTHWNFNVSVSHPLLKYLTRKCTLRNLKQRVNARFLSVNYPFMRLIWTNVCRP